MTSDKANNTNLARRFRRLTQILLRYKNILAPVKPGYELWIMNAEKNSSSNELRSWDEADSRICGNDRRHDLFRSSDEEFLKGIDGF